MIERKSPKYVQVQNSLRQLILNGVYLEGDALPSENDLCAQFGITRMTVRNALSTLEKDGLIRKFQGKGSIVQSKRKSIEILSIKGFSAVMKAENIPLKTIVLKKPTITPWPNDFFFDLSELESAAGCIQLERLRQIEDKPIMYETTFIPNMNLPRFCTSSFINHSLFDTLQIRYGIEVTSVKQKFRAVTGLGRYKSLLRLKPGQPLLHILRKMDTSNKNLNIYSSVFFNAENHLIEI